MHLALEPIIKKELNKLVVENIIFLVRHTEWVANLFPVRKKNGDMQLCVDFRNLNKDWNKDNYYVPPMEHVLQSVSSLEMLYLLYGFLGYN